ANSEQTVQVGGEKTAHIALKVGPSHLQAPVKYHAYDNGADVARDLLQRILQMDRPRIQGPLQIILHGDDGVGTLGPDIRVQRLVFWRVVVGDKIQAKL